MIEFFENQFQFRERGISYLWLDCGNVIKTVKKKSSSTENKNEWLNYNEFEFELFLENFNDILKINCNFGKRGHHFIFVIKVKVVKRSSSTENKSGEIRPSWGS